MTTTFDTYKFVDSLEKVGIPHEQVMVMLEHQKEVMSKMTNNISSLPRLCEKESDCTLLTKDDISRLENQIVRLEHHIDKMAYYQISFIVDLLIFSAAVFVVALNIFIY